LAWQYKTFKAGRTTPITVKQTNQPRRELAMTTDELRQDITNQIIEALKSGGLPPWQRPWTLDPNCGSARSLSSLKGYRGINILILAASAMKNGYRSRWWGSYQAIKQSGGYVKKGEKATNIVLFRPITKTVIGESGEEKEETFPLMRTFAVFNAEQTNLDFLKAGRTELAPAVMDQRYEKADAAVALTRATIHFGGNQPRYSPSLDCIEMPFRHQFTTMAEYYQTLAHETVHWTGHEDRLDRVKHSYFGDQSYALEELIAEIGGCFFCEELGLGTGDNLDNHHAYLKSWLSAMEDDPRFIFTASAQASKAVDYILSFSKAPVEEAVLEEVPF
jgi:antirestriction protein ArdC